MSTDYTPELRTQLTRVADAYVREASLNAAVKHLLGRGKLYRPRLALATYEAVTGAAAGPEQIEAVTPLEIIHTFTLIHDDLPCMDDAELRRGVEAVHVRFGEAMAVLAGDALCSLAFEVIAHSRGGRLSPPSALYLVTVLASATQTVVAGQVEDLAAEGRSLTRTEIEQLYQRKTGALLGACCEFGATLANANQELASGLRGIGLRLGLLFQLRDDLLSAESTEEQVGKSLHTDATLEKSTLVRLMGLEAAKAYAREKEQELIAAIAELDLKSPDVLVDICREAYARSS